MKSSTPRPPVRSPCGPRSRTAGRGRRSRRRRSGWPSGGTDRRGAARRRRSGTSRPSRARRSTRGGRRASWFDVVEHCPERLARSTMVSNMSADEPDPKSSPSPTVMAALSDPMRVAIVRQLASRASAPAGLRARHLEGDAIASLPRAARGRADAHPCRGDAPACVAAPRGRRRALPGLAERRPGRRRARSRAHRGPRLIASLAIFESSCRSVCLPTTLAWIV